MNKITLRVDFEWRRESSAYNNPFQYDWVFLSIEYDDIVDIRFNECRKKIKDDIKEWTGRGEIKIIDAEFTVYGTNTHIKKIHDQLKKNMVGKIYKFNN